jgi:hypothetical protein
MLVLNKMVLCQKTQLNVVSVKEHLISETATKSIFRLNDKLEPNFFTSQQQCLTLIVPKKVTRGHKMFGRKTFLSQIPALKYGIVRKISSTK